MHIRALFVQCTYTLESRTRVAAAGGRRTVVACASCCCRRMPASARPLWQRCARQGSATRSARRTLATWPARARALAAPPCSACHFRWPTRWRPRARHCCLCWGASERCTPASIAGPVSPGASTRSSSSERVLREFFFISKHSRYSLIPPGYDSFSRSGVSSASDFF